MNRTNDTEHLQMPVATVTERVETVIIGGGQAGLTAGYYLASSGLSFIIVDAHKAIGDAWRNRWDSLRLFTSNRYNSLPGMPFPGARHAFATKDEMADYLAEYAASMKLPVRTGINVDLLSREGDHFVITAGHRRFVSDNVVVAMATYQKPRVPEFARYLDPNIDQMHSSEYRNPAQLQEGSVLIAGAGNSGSEIALEVAGSHRTLMSGRDTGYLPFRIDGMPGRLFLVPMVLRFFFHRVATMSTPVGRKLHNRFTSQGGPLIRVKPRDISDAGIDRVPTVTGVQDGRPKLADGHVLDVSNVIWCTGFHPGFSWIDLPVFGENGKPIHRRGVVSKAPGLYFLGLHFLYSASSGMIHGVARDAEYIVKAIMRRARETPPRVDKHINAPSTETVSAVESVL